MEVRFSQTLIEALRTRLARPPTPDDFRAIVARDLDAEIPRTGRPRQEQFGEAISRALSDFYAEIGDSNGGVTAQQIAARVGCDTRTALHHLNSSIGHDTRTYFDFKINPRGRPVEVFALYFYGQHPPRMDMLQSLDQALFPFRHRVLQEMGAMGASEHGIRFDAFALEFAPNMQPKKLFDLLEMAERKYLIQVFPQTGPFNKRYVGISPARFEKILYAQGLTDRESPVYKARMAQGTPLPPLLPELPPYEIAPPKPTRAPTEEELRAEEDRWRMERDARMGIDTMTGKRIEPVLLK